MATVQTKICIRARHRHRARVRQDATVHNFVQHEISELWTHGGKLSAYGKPMTELEADKPTPLLGG